MQLFKKSFLTILRRIDLFGVSINIRFKDQDKYRTCFGGVFTLFLWATMFILIYNVSQQILRKLQPQVLQDDLVVQQPHYFSLTPETFSFAFGIFDQENFIPFIDPQYFTAQADFTYKTSEMDSSGNKKVVFNSKQINLIPCTKESFRVKDTEDYFLSLNYTNLYCLDYTQDLFLIGQFDADFFSVVEIHIYQCVGQGCKDKTEIENRLTSTFMQVYYSSSVVQPTNFEQPFKSVGQTQFYYTNVQQSQAVNMQYMNTYMVDQTGIFNTEEQTQTALIFTEDRLLFQNYQQLFLISIFLEKNREKCYYRSYLTLKDALTQIGGVFNFLFLVGSIVCQPYSKIQLQRKLLNSTFNFPSKQNDIPPKQSNNPKEQKDLSSSSKSGKKLKNLPKNSQMLKQALRKGMQNSIKTGKLNISENQEDTSKEDYIKKIFQNTYQKAKVKSQEFFMLLLQTFSFVKSDMYEMLVLGKHKIYQYTDISFVINKLIEIEKIKHLLLEEEQIKLFEFIPKPNLKSIYKQAKRQKTEIDVSTISQNKPTQIERKNSQQEINILSIENKNMEFKAQQAKEAFYQIYKNKLKQSKIDKKLITMLDKDLIYYVLAQQPTQDNQKINSTIGSIYSKEQVNKQKFIDESFNISLNKSGETKIITFQDKQFNLRESKSKITYHSNIDDCFESNYEENQDQSQTAYNLNQTKEIPQKLF